MKNDEKKLLILVNNECGKETGEMIRLFNITYPEKVSPRDLINRESFDMHHKRAWYLLDKWSRKRWYEYGVTLDLGWLTNEGKKKAQELIAEEARAWT
ncbi:hypothetical protein [Paenibacillus rhizolycopersici]|uniref:hypothetical protein n=1 Tax=Paenibacillus rhizolycopersici TaxID=2780073 RepID=UPI003D28CC5C